MSEKTATPSGRPYFFWDYDITEEEIHDILRGDNEVERAWVITRILEYARWEDIWRYLTVDEVRESFEQLGLKPYLRDLWAYAIEVWSNDDQ